MVKKEISDYLAKLGAKGGKASADKLTKQQRIERATKAVQARERKRKGGAK